ncbi:copper amine oxidase N-terminal domain-containing protein [Desulfofundulus thermosubterraneus]|uniref:Copper amine oxidase N-terminal domain-containing protein n=1 Tax=Desulfofundulus thermosubterraneus DSM 16057 TaxID=1121432 RepID=A0A1M6IBD3_9FIRM|nr:copper amine oxidase N-terminal domain-containing protein [Desulfofundulus thermosubterraneus]SHJ31715.1 Copper amine oxidase N-terminal domain-containing protein [Desulfofundulus thermosubterraneus DSM 16057]
MKRAVMFISFLVLLFLFPMVSPAFSSPTVIVDGRALSFDVSPVIENSRTLVPIRAIFEALGADVSWDDITQSITVTKGTTKIKLTIDQVTAYKNDLPVILDVPVRIINNRTFVPLRFVSEALESKVNWDVASQTITIISMANPSEGKQQKGCIGAIDYSNPNKYTVNGKQS